MGEAMFARGSAYSYQGTFGLLDQESREAECAKEAWAPRAGRLVPQSKLAGCPRAVTPTSRLSPYTCCRQYQWAVHR